MNLLFVIYTHNRPTILQDCLSTLLNNTTIRPDEILISDDNSSPELKAGLLKFAVDNSKSTPINFMSFNAAQGIGRHFEFGFEYIKMRNPKYVVCVESDYVFRQGWLEDCLALLKAKPSAVGISGYSNPDFWNGKTETLFPEVMVEHFSDDPAPRQLLHKPTTIQTEVGDMLIQTTTNSCCTYVLNWERITELTTKYPEMKVKVFDRAANKQPGGDRRHFGDGPLTSGLSYYWYKDVAGNPSVNYSEDGPWLDICDASIANHINGGGINGYIVSEMTSFVSSPKWVGFEFKRKQHEHNT